MAQRFLLNSKKIQAQSTPSPTLKKSLVQLSGLEKSLVSKLTDTPTFKARNVLGRIWRAHAVRCFRYSAKFALIYCVLTTRPNKKHVLWRKFNLKIAAKANLRTTKQLRVLRLNRYRRTVLYSHSYQRVVLRRRRTTFRRKFSVLRRVRQMHFNISRPRKRPLRYKKNRTSRTFFKHKGNFSNSSKKSKKAYPTKAFKFKHNIYRRRTGRSKLRRWERRKNRSAVLAATFRIRSLSLVRRPKYNRVLTSYEIHNKNSRRSFIHRSKKFFTSVANVLRYRTSEFSYRRRQLRRSLRHQKNRGRLVCGAPKSYIRHHYQNRIFLTFRARWRRWPFYVRRIRTFYFPRRCRKKSLRLRRRASRKRKLRIHKFSRPFVPAFHNLSERSVLGRLRLLRRARSCRARTVFARRVSLACKVLFGQHDTVQLSLLRNITSTQTQFLHNDNLRISLLTTKTSTYPVHYACDAQKKRTIVSSLPHEYLSRPLLGTVCNVSWGRTARVGAALRARRIRLQYFTGLVTRAKIASQRSLHIQTQRVRARHLLKRRMWQKLFHKYIQNKKLYWRRLVRIVRRRIVRRRARAVSCCYSTAKSLLSKKHFFWAHHSKKNVKLARTSRKHKWRVGRKFITQKRLSKMRYGAVKNFRFQALRRRARKFGRKVSRKFGRRFKRTWRRRRPRFHSTFYRRRPWEITRRFKFKRAPHLVAQLTTRMFVQDGAFSRLHAVQRPRLRISLRSTKLHYRKLFDRYQFYVASRAVSLSRKHRSRRKMLFTNFTAVRHTKKTTRCQAPALVATQTLTTINRVPLRLQLFAAQLLATDALGTPLAPYMHSSCSIAEVK